MKHGGFTLYRYYSKTGELLYIGQTNELDARNKEHRSAKAWYPMVASSTYEHYDTRAEVVAAEREAIINEQPRFNIEHNGNRRSPMPRELRTEPMAAASVQKVTPKVRSTSIPTSSLPPIINESIAQALLRIDRLARASHHQLGGGAPWDEAWHQRNMRDHYLFLKNQRERGES